MSTRFSYVATVKPACREIGVNHGPIFQLDLEVLHNDSENILITLLTIALTPLYFLIKNFTFSHVVNYASAQCNFVSVITYALKEQLTCNKK